MSAARNFASILALSAALLVPAPQAAAATILVTKTADTADGSCDADCSLREAVILANSSTNADIIEVPAGHYRLTITGPPEDAGLSGDLEVMNSVTINGAGAGSTLIDAGGMTGLGERVFEVAAFDTSSMFDVTFSGLTITGGWATGGFADNSGGGIEVRGGADVALVDVGIIDNYVSFSGAGLQTEPDSILTLLRTTVAENSTTFNGLGAGIMASGESVTIDDSTISHNSAMANGGGIVVFAATLTVRNSTISANRADASGGGISADASAVVDLRNVTLTDNVADDDNDGNGDGGGIHRGNSAITMRNTILAGNRDVSTIGTVHPDCTGGVTSGGYNLVGNLTGCTFTPGAGDRTGVQPVVGPLADNGGPTQTHALLPGSQAIDGGNPGPPGSGGAACQASDQRGAPRSTCDIGAYELVRCGGTVVNRVGTEGPDKLVGTPGPDGFLALGGNDLVKGLGGNDAACLGPGHDIGAGGGGKDRLFGEQGKDRLKGQGGNDRLVGGPGKDTCVGGRGKKDKAACETEKSVP
ncbi:MAG: choice-of-anchor Q domain-containing protein [Actinomycetota bacterium]